MEGILDVVTMEAGGHVPSAQIKVVTAREARF